MEYVQMTLDDWVQMKQKLKQELLGVKQSFVRIGYVLRQIDDQKLYEQDGYKSIAEFAQAEYGLGPSITSRFMSINREYSIDGYSEQLRQEYAELGRSQLEEMLKLPDTDRQMIQPETSREDIRELKRFNKTEPAAGVADDISQLVEKFYQDNELILNAVYGEEFDEQTINRFIEIVNPAGNRSYKKGLYFMMMYENRVTFKKFGDTPKDMTWWEFYKLTQDIFEGNTEMWQKYFKKKRQTSLENTQSDVIEPKEPKNKTEDLGLQNVEETEEPNKKKEKETEEIAPAQKVEKSQKIQSYSQLSDDITGQTEIEKDFPEMLPEAGETPEIQNKEENCTSAMPEPVEIVEKPVDNSEQMEENARNTEAGANSEPVDKSEEEQNPAGSRWEYMKTMESYKMALYMAASVKEMPHMMLNSAEYWKKWLEAEVDENGDELSKK